MRKFFDLIKTAAKAIDGFWIENAGHPIVVSGVFRPTNNNIDNIYCEDRDKIFESMHVTIYGFYDYPTTSYCTTFGIDALNDLEVQLNAELLLKKLGKFPEIGTLLYIEQSNWLVINRSWVYNRFIGKYRISLICQRYQESVTTGKNGIRKRPYYGTKR
jgi:hypothetical protein